MATHFRQLNDRWNAEPNAPDPTVRVEGASVVLDLVANSFHFSEFTEGHRISVRFFNAWRYRLGRTNDEGWYMGQCRFSKDAPAWGEFYEVSGDLKLTDCPEDWVVVGVPPGTLRHFLFYLRDETFECEADDWALDE